MLPDVNFQCLKVTWLIFNLVVSSVICRLVTLDFTRIIENALCLHGIFYAFQIFLLPATLTSTRLDAFCVLQDLWLSRHQLIPVLLIRISSRYTLLAVIIFDFFLLSPNIVQLKC